MDITIKDNVTAPLMSDRMWSIVFAKEWKSLRYARRKRLLLVGIHWEAILRLAIMAHTSYKPFGAGLSNG